MVELGANLDRPDLLDMTPVDWVARATAQLARFWRHPTDPTVVPTFHLTNLSQSVSYAQLGEWTRSFGYEVVPCTYEEFRGRLETTGSGGSTGPGAGAGGKAAPPASAASASLDALRPFFPAGAFSMTMGPWDTSFATAALSTHPCPPVTEAYIHRMLSALNAGGHLRDPPAEPEAAGVSPTIGGAMPVTARPPRPPTSTAAAVVSSQKTANLEFVRQIQEALALDPNTDLRRLFAGYTVV